MDKIRQLLKLHEGVKDRPYRCTADKLTIGVGHNLDDKAISKEAIEQILEDDLEDVLKEVGTLSYWGDLDAVRQAVLIDMCFNLGFSGLKKFKKMHAALNLGDYVEAANQMMDSRWSTQVGSRSKRLEKMMISGGWPSELS